MFNLVPFLSYVFVVTFTPGPNNIMSMVNANKYGFKKTFNFTLGIFTGFIVIMLLCSYFNLVLFNIMPKIKIFMGLLGAGYMTYLAVKVMNSKSEEDNNNIQKDIKNNVHEKIVNNQSICSFYTGMTMQFINPKVILYGITVISNFIIPYYKSNLYLFLFSIFLATIALVSTLCWAMFGILFQKFLSKYRKPFNIAMGILLIYSAISISGITNFFYK